MKNKIAIWTILVSVGYSYISVTGLFWKLSGSYIASVYITGFVGLAVTQVFFLYAIIKIGNFLNKLEELKSELEESRFHHQGRITYLERQLEIYTQYFDGEFDYSGLEKKLSQLNDDAIEVFSEQAQT